MSREKTQEGNVTGALGTDERGDQVGAASRNAARCAPDYEVEYFVP